MPYWFPSETSGGAVREARLVLPIPPGTHWSDAKPAILPGMKNVNVFPAEGHSREGGNPGDSGSVAALTGSPPARRRRQRKTKKVEAPAPQRPKSAAQGGLWFAPPKPPPPTAEEIARANEEKKKAKRPRFRNDPKLIAAARELRDRYTERINAGLLLPPSACGKYDVSRALEHAPFAMRVESHGKARLFDAA